ncbi:MAG: hypothetical protein COY80_02925 [Candidatus Pacebacteria bacterium CG_4_10_14_0_8_um_filter_42_14]|nr:MAG: hypothetical protein COY80_02925 [Candidatus Pacebacteria bacterium CG_4_10_14_0_8_um_filter_42_14]
MHSSVVDTNVLLRFLVGDNSQQQKIAHTWFQEAESGKRQLIIKPLVIAETTFVLESFYKQSREKIADSLETLLAQKWLVVEERTVMNKLWYWYKNGLHFVDSYLLAWSKNNKAELLTFDKELIKK